MPRAAIGHVLSLARYAYDGLAIDGIDPTVAQAARAPWSSARAHGRTVVPKARRAARSVSTSYFVRLATSPADGLPSTSRSRLALEPRRAGGRRRLAVGREEPARGHVHAHRGDRRRDDRRPRPRVVLMFDLQQLEPRADGHVYGVNDGFAEGERTLTVNHSVPRGRRRRLADGRADDQAATVATFDFAPGAQRRGQDHRRRRAGADPHADRRHDPGARRQPRARCPGLCAGHCRQLQPAPRQAAHGQPDGDRDAELRRAAGGPLRRRRDRAGRWPRPRHLRRGELARPASTSNITAVDDGTREDFKRSFVSATVTDHSDAPAYAGQLAQLAVERLRQRRRRACSCSRATVRPRS